MNSITVNSAETAVKLNGLENSPIHDLFFENVNIKANKGFAAENAKNITMKNTQLQVPGNQFSLKDKANVRKDTKMVK